MAEAPREDAGSAGRHRFLRAVEELRRSCAAASDGARSRIESGQPPALVIDEISATAPSRSRPRGARPCGASKWAHRLRDGAPRTATHGGAHVRSHSSRRGARGGRLARGPGKPRTSSKESPGRGSPPLSIPRSGFSTTTRTCISASRPTTTSRTSSSSAT